LGDHAIAASCSLGLFVVAVAIGLAGADKPPPPGFLILVAALAVLSAVAHLRLVANLRALGDLRWGRFVRIGVEGLLGVVALALSLTVITGGGPEGSTRSGEIAILCVVVGIVGAVAAVLVWAAALGLRARRG
jgi:hypothetical protein